MCSLTSTLLQSCCLLIWGLALVECRPAFSISKPSIIPSAAELCRRAVLQSLDDTQDQAVAELNELAIDEYCNAVEVVPESKAVVLHHERRAREIYPPDDRRRVSDRLYSRHPFASVVKISTGCTGGLITPHHVLTAAHCLHNNGEYSRRIAIGEPETLEEVRRNLGQSLHADAHILRSYHWHRTQSVRVPPEWGQDTSDRPAYDFGLVTLQPDDCIEGSYLTMQPMTIERLRALTKLSNQVLHITSFADDKLPGTLWYRYCGVEHVDDDGMIFFDCDTIFGSSGAAVYAYIGLGNDPITGKRIVRRRILAINSGNRNFIDSRGRSRRLNVATGITWERYREICSWAPDMCDQPDYLEREQSESWIMTCGGPPTTPPTSTTEAQTTSTISTDAMTASNATSPSESQANRLQNTGEEGEEGSNGTATVVPQTLPGKMTEEKVAPTVPPPTTEPTTDPELARFLRICAGLGASLRADCLRWARRSSQGR